MCVDGFKLTCGPVLVAIDLSEDSRPQLEAASRMAQLAGQGLLVITVDRADVPQPRDTNGDGDDAVV